MKGFREGSIDISFLAMTGMLSGQGTLRGHSGTTVGRKVRGYLQAHYTTIAAFVCLIGTLTLCCGALHAQNAYGSVVGSVTDNSGNVVVGATVTLTNVGTGDKRNMATNGAGDYDFVNIVPGNYRVDVEDTGFKHFTRINVVVQVQGSTRVDAALAVGTVSQTVEVTSAAPLIETQQATVGQVVEGRVVSDMPLNGKMVFNLLALTPGVVPQGGTAASASNAASGNEGNAFSQGNYQISGGIPNTEAVFVDGAPINNGYINAISYAPAQESIQEFRIEANNIGPEFGSTEDGVMTMITKSGNNDFHGDSYDYLRNTVLNSNTFYGDRAHAKKPAFIQNQFGATLGGPIKKDRLFFFFSYEGIRAAIGSTATDSVPNYTMDGAGDITLNNLTKAITDPGYWTTSPCSGAGCPDSGEVSTWTAAAPGTTFPNYTIPANRINPTAKAMLYLWPQPQPAFANLNVNNYIINTTVRPVLNQYTSRMDWNASAKQRIFGRYTFHRFVQPGAPPFGVITSNLTLARNTVNSMVLGDDVTLNSKTVLNLDLSYFRDVGWSGATGIPFNLTPFDWPAATVAQLDSPVLPRATVSGYTTNGGGGQYIPATTENYALSGSLTKLLGRHTILAGGEFRRAPDNYGQTNSTDVETFNFNTDFSNNAFANFLLGIPQATIEENVIIPANVMYYAGAYLGDTYHVNNRLTLDLGIRWEYPGYWKERHDRQGVFLANLTNPMAATTGLPLKGDEVLVNTSAYPHRTNEIPVYHDFAPRLGAAFRLTPRMVIRGGWGLFYAPTAAIQQDAQPYQNPVELAFTNLAAGANAPTNSLDNPFPTGVLQPVGRSANYESVIEGQNVDAVVPKEPSTYTEQWNVDFERDFGHNMMVDIAYVGNHGIHQQGPAGLNDTGYSMNQLPDQDDSMGAALSAPVANPLIGVGTLITSGNLSGPTIPAGQLLRPYPQYYQLYNAAAVLYFSKYKSLQVKFQKRFGSGGTLLGVYTWANDFGNADTQTGFQEGIQPGEVQDFTNLAAENSQLSYNIPQRTVISYVLDAPVGQGKFLLGSVKPATNRVVGGWGLDGITTFQSGFPLIFLEQPTQLTANFGAGSPRPNVVSGCNKMIGGSAFSKTLPGATWFNTSCFAQTGPYAFGNEPRVDPDLRTQGIANWDMAIFKQTQITERFGFQFRAEMFNTFNRVQFGYPGITCCSAVGSGTGVASSTSFGVISGLFSTNNPRQIQFAMKVTY